MAYGSTAFMIVYVQISCKCCPPSNSNYHHRPLSRFSSTFNYRRDYNKKLITTPTNLHTRFLHRKKSPFNATGSRGITPFSFSTVNKNTKILVSPKTFAVIVIFQ